MTPSPYQSAIFDYLRHSDGHLVVKACAGAAKTTTAIWSLKHVDPAKRILFLAFNKSIATTLQTRVPPSVKASTIHSQGFAACKQLYPNAVTDFDKVYNATQSLCKDNRWVVPKDERAAFLGRIRKIVDLMRLTLVETSEGADDLCSIYDIENYDGEVGYAMEVFQDVKLDTARIDFTDMIYIPATHDFKVKGYDLIYIDEFQDCSRAQYVLIKKLLRPGGRMVMIGDPRQAIYAHLGCDPHLFDEAAAEPNTEVLPLSISYRCPAAVVRHAQKLVPEIEARDGAPEGKVVLQGSIHNVKDGDVVLCRTNFPLVQLCLSLLREGRKAIVRGNDVGKGLASFLKPWQGLSVAEMRQGVEGKHANLVRKLIRKYPDRDLDTVQEYQAMTEKVQIINVLSDDCDTVEQVLAKITRIFSDEMGVGIILSTVHRFKGLEADNVFIVEPQLIPFPYYLTQPWQIEQERNIDYVARTRAVVKLEYIRDWTCFKKGPSKSPLGKRADQLAGEARQAGRKHVDVTDDEVAAEVRKLRRDTFAEVNAS